jgi:beta-lactamase class A
MSIWAHITKKNLHEVFIVFGIVIVMSYQAGLYMQKERYASFLKSFKNIRENSDKYTLINPLIGGVSAPATDVGIYEDIKEEVVSFLQDEEKKGNLYDYSFYFRDFGTGFWFGSNESADFFPASLFKLPISIAIYKQGEDDPSFLKRTAVYTQELANMNISVTSNSESVLMIGKAYSVEELVSIMITKSDNGAKDMLVSLIDKKYLNQLFQTVSLIDPEATKVYLISSRKYAYFLRVLYGSSYLNEEHSEYLLSLLTKSTFKDGLVAGVPQNVPIAHKYGTYEFEENVNGRKVLAEQLHDCGIVYHVEKPYVFCFMTKGKDVETLYRIISHVSKLVYDYQEKSDE